MTKTSTYIRICTQFEWGITGLYYTSMERNMEAYTQTVKELFWAWLNWGRVKEKEREAKPKRKNIKRLPINKQKQQQINSCVLS